ncbi:hypothetical protein RSPO_m01542 (plasmid) [Ralstonia solanacearum Po82]|uniref:Uncharacterized protein n=1 Tax=Ralstonia solanacearum (strain Po82) TaxID=1031711 RepID=F6GBN7_RALS8|nr:hypothetical protein RSPO_m01542 [Ralstonia solanacearum Po82]
MGYACPPLGRHIPEAKLWGARAGMAARSEDRISEMGRSGATPAATGHGPALASPAAAQDAEARRRPARAAGCTAPRLPLS